MVEGKLINQGQALNRGVLTEAIIDAYAKRSEVSGNVLFGKATCPHCVRAKSYLDEAGIDYAYHDVIRNPQALYEMLTRVKPIVGPKPPITVPQL
jgi:glutaredoxin